MHKDSSRPVLIFPRMSCVPRTGHSRAGRICSKPVCRVCSPPVMCAAGTSSVLRRQLAKVQSLFRWSINVFANNLAQVEQGLVLQSRSDGQARVEHYARKLNPRQSVMLTNPLQGVAQQLRNSARSGYLASEISQTEPNSLIPNTKRWNRNLLNR